MGCLSSTPSSYDKGQLSTEKKMDSQSKPNAKDNPNLLIHPAHENRAEKKDAAKTPEGSVTSQKDLIINSYRSRPEFMRSTDTLRYFLQSNGVDATKFGKGNAKSLASLLEELRSSACFLEVNSNLNDKGLIRVVEPVFIRFCWRGHVLVEESQEMADGRQRLRRMFLAEKREPRDEGGLFSTVVRSIEEELGIPKEKLTEEGILRYRADTYRFEVENIESPSYPGLLSCYRTHYVQVDLMDGGQALFSHCGVPDCTDFITKEQTKLGEPTHFWRWYTIDDALSSGITKFPQKLSGGTVLGSSEGATENEKSTDGCSFTPVPLSELADVESLSVLMVKAGIDVAKFGTGKAKSLEALLKEIKSGESVLECEGGGGSNFQVRRVVQPVFVQLRFKDKVCVEVEQVFDDGRSRARNMLLAEKKSPEDPSIQVAAIRGVLEELDLSSLSMEVEACLQFRPEAYCCIAENLESASYPGLQCVYITHYCRIDIAEHGLHLLTDCGLPEGNPFVTKEKDKTNKWQWKSVEEAIDQKVKGFPQVQCQDLRPADAESAAGFEPIKMQEELTLASLRVMLEMGGVNVSAWGDYTAAALLSLQHELNSGISRLERDDKGNIRRVLSPALVQMKVRSIPESGNELLQRRHSTESLACIDCSDSIRSFGSTLTYRADISCFEVAQHMDTLSYPGLACVHQTQLVQLDKVPDAK